MLFRSADSFKAPAGKKIGATVGARRINFILGIIWSVVVTLMAFGYGLSAVQKMGNYRYNGKLELRPLTLGLVLDDWLPAFLLLVTAAAGIFVLLWARARDTDN